MTDIAVKDIIEKYMNCRVSEVNKIGSGASANIYKIKADKEPFTFAVKFSRYPDLLLKEYETIKFISERVDCKLPKLYKFVKEENFAVLVMEYLNGVSAIGKNLRFKCGKSKLADEIVDNLLKIHSIHNDKFGPVNNAVYDTWFDYYSEFASEIYSFTLECMENKRVPDIVFKAVESSYKNLAKIVVETGEKPTLIHGDYWTPNLLVDTKSMSLAGVVDPFNVMWTEPEYELFTLTAGYGSVLKLYQNYKSKVETSRFCDLKVELYALYNEIYWFKNTGKVSVAYLVYRSRRLLKQMKRNNIL